MVDLPMKFSDIELISFYPIERNRMKMHQHEIVSVLDKIGAKNFRYPVEFTYHPFNDGGGIQLQMWVLCRETGKETSILNWKTLPMEAKAVDVVRLCHELLSETMQHEVDEAFHYCGKRIFDPHPGETIKIDITLGQL